jgi:hypothetical protein
VKLVNVGQLAETRIALALVLVFRRQYATRHKVAGSRPDEVNNFFLICLILSAALGPGVYSASNRYEYQK